MFGFKHSRNDIDLSASVVGKSVVAWSEDQCIATASNENVSVYELNPIKNVGEVFNFKIQILPCGNSVKFNSGIEQEIKEFNQLRMIPLKDGAAPCYDSYSMFLDGDIFCLEKSHQALSPGASSVGFSPLGCTSNGACVLAILNTGHRLKLYSRDKLGFAVGWTELVDVSEALIEVLLENQSYFPGHAVPEDLDDVLLHKHLGAYITCFAWSNLFSKHSHKFVYLATTTRNDFLLVWKIQLPLDSNSKLSIQNYIPVGMICNCVTSLQCSGTSEEYVCFCVGGSEGLIKCMKISFKDGSLVKQSVIWREIDDLSVSDISWTEKEKGSTEIMAAKDSILMYFRLSSTFSVISSSVLKGIHPLAIVNIEILGTNAWLLSSSDGTVLKVWVNNEKNSKHPKLEYTTGITGRDPISSSCPEITYNAVNSPNHAFLASVTSIPKIIVSVMSENCGYLSIRSSEEFSLFEQKLTSIEDCCIHKTEPFYPPLDVWEAIRFQMMNDEKNLSIFCDKLFEFAKSPIQTLQSRWFAIKIINAGKLPIKVDTRLDYSNLLSEIERQIVGYQMIKVLKLWYNDDTNVKCHSLPIRGIVIWLQQNQRLLNEKDMEFFKNLKKSKMYNNTKREKCAITGEALVLSPDARWVVTEISKMEWPCCSFTFCALQEYQTRKCDICNSRCKMVADSMDECTRTLLMSDRSIYSGCFMI